MTTTTTNHSDASTRPLSIDEVLAHLLEALSDADPSIKLPVYKVMVRKRHRGVLRTVGDLRGLTATQLTDLPGLGRTVAHSLLVETARRAGVSTALVADETRLIPTDRTQRVLHALHCGLEVRFGARKTPAGRMQRCVYAVDPAGGDRALGYNETDGVAAGMIARLHGKLVGLIVVNRSENGVTTYSLTDEGAAEAKRRFDPVQG